MSEKKKTSQVDWNYWQKMSPWKLLEGVILIHRQPPTGSDSANTLYLSMNEDIKKIYKFAERAFDSGELPPHHLVPSFDLVQSHDRMVDPATFLNWAKSKGLTIPNELKPLCKSEAKTKEPEKTIETPATEKKLRPSQRHRKAVIEVAKKLWVKDPDITIADMIFQDEINSVFKDRKNGYTDRTLREWIKEYCPNRSPGRRPKKHKSPK